MRRCSFFAQRGARILTARPVTSGISSFHSTSSSSLRASPAHHSPSDAKVVNSLKKVSGISLSSESQLAIQTFVSMIRQLQQKKDMELMKRLESAAAGVPPVASSSHTTLEDKAKMNIRRRMKATKARLKIAKKALGQWSKHNEANKDAEKLLEQKLEKALEEEKEEEMKILKENKSRLEALKAQRKSHMEERQRVKRLRMELKAYGIFEKLIEKFQLQRYKEVQSGMDKFQKQQLKEAKEEAMKKAALEAKEREKMAKEEELKKKNTPYASIRAVKSGAMTEGGIKTENKDPAGSTTTKESPVGLSISANEEKNNLQAEKPTLTEEEKALELAKKRLHRLEVLTHSDPTKEKDPKAVEEKVRQLLKVSSLLQKTAASLRDHTKEGKSDKDTEDTKPDASKSASSKRKNELNKKNNSEAAEKKALLSTSALTEHSASEEEKAVKGVAARVMIEKVEKAPPLQISGSSRKKTSSVVSKHRLVQSSPSSTSGKTITQPTSQHRKANRSEKKKMMVGGGLKVQRIAEKLTFSPSASSLSKTTTAPSSSAIAVSPRHEAYNPTSVMIREESNSQAVARIDSARKEYFALLEQEKERKLAIAAAEHSGAGASFPNVRREDLSWTVPVSSGGLFRL